MQARQSGNVYQLVGELVARLVSKAVERQMADEDDSYSMT